MQLLSDFDLTRNEIEEILALSEKIKATPAKYADVMKNKTLIMLFELASLRTRISFEAGMNMMGGHAIFYSIEEGNFTRSETLEDGIKNLNKYVNCIMARLLKQEDIERIGSAATIPVINGMTEVYHPCQNLADLLTIKEYKGDLEGLKVAYVGDGGCNTANSTMIGCSSMGMDVTVICPDYPKYSPAPEILLKIKAHNGSEVAVSHDPVQGVANADVIYTDVWVSAGMEEEKKQRMEAFPPYQVDSALVSKAKPDCIVMHCLPAHRGYEITEGVMDSVQSVVFDQAGNRMHAQNGLLYWLMK
ncbi:MAG: ornithine carbamoyltransferase [Candidatus Bathyarchaeota archaeon]|nr:MAG: ornithine carbamoyltransferase [Candidatus Bathyarchaeota archaeon]